MHTYIVAEVGQNHNGDMTIAKRLIDVAAAPVVDKWSGQTLPGVDAVKFTKRCLDEEMTTEEGARPYDSPNAFGRTYMEHRKALELTFEQHAELEQYARSKGLQFVETLCSPGCIRLLDYLKVDRIKVASRDITNIPLLERLGATGMPIVLSSGMSDLTEIERAVDVVSRTPRDVAVLHCVSQYPAEYRNINLCAITLLKEHFPRLTIGYSDHSIGIVVPVAAVALGAEIIEKHITLDRRMKGSDHAGALEPDGLWRMVRDIRNLETALGDKKKDIQSCVASTAMKLKRSLAVRRDIGKGETIAAEDLVMLSPGDGLPWSEKDCFIGKAARRHLKKRSHISREDVE